MAFPANMGPPSDPLVTPEHIKPEWYFLPFYHLLKIVAGSVGVVILGIFGTIFFLWPIFEHFFPKNRSKNF